MTPTYAQIRPYVEKGLISELAHPDNADVRMFDYTKECKKAKMWDELTIACRGLILNVKTGEVVANPFPRIQTYGKKHVPPEVPVVTEKVLGSPGILYWLGNRPRIATRGSFTSEQAIWATEWLRSNLSDYTQLNKAFTYLFEIVSPSALFLLAIRERETGMEVYPYTMFWREPMKLPEKYPFESYEVLEKSGKELILYYPSDAMRLKMNCKN